MDSLHSAKFYWRSDYQSPEGCVIDTDGNLNAASNTLNVNATIQGEEPIEETLVPSSMQTVDRLDHTPGNGSNNMAKFTAGSINFGVANPYTTDFYVRSSGSDESRNVRAFVRFDLDASLNLPVLGASLTFNGHTLNTHTDVNLEVVALAEDWSAVGSPLPTYSHATVGDAVNGGSIITGLDSSDRTRDYEFDLTSIVQNWLAGTWSNHGLQIRLASDTLNNGLGIKPVDPGSMQLSIQYAPLIIKSFTFSGDQDLEDVNLTWTSAPGATYIIQANEDLQSEWEFVGQVLATGVTTTYIHSGGLIGFDKRFYRVLYIPSQQ